MQWMGLLFSFAVIAIHIGLILPFAAYTPNPACSPSTFQSVLPDYAIVEKVARVAKGGTYGEGSSDIAYPTQPTNLPELCALTIKVTTSSRSFHRFGLFLPTKSAWNQKFLALGSGGFAGGINWLEMGSGVRYGFATIASDTGHNSTTTDASWALNNPDRLADWGWRALDDAVDIAKKLTARYYSQNISYSYYSGCSTGGRQGLKQIQISPESFDGALIGAPAWWPTHLNTYVTKLGSYNLPVNDPKHIGVALFPAIADEVMKQCDEIDGVKDGIISSPDKCIFDFDPLLCSRPGANQSACLTPAQINAAKNFYSDYRAASGELLYPGLTLGSERMWTILLSGSQPSAFGVEFARYFLFNDPNWNWQEFNDNVVYFAEGKDPGNASAEQYDLSPFETHGGKILMYQGLADGLVPPKGTDLYYDRVATQMGGLDRIRDFFRYFHVPGMQHCYNTVVDAPWDIGAGFQASLLGNDVYSVPGFKDAGHDALLALMDWVEKGNTVDQIIATTWKSPTNPSTKVLRQRPVCAYPLTATWNRRGIVDSADSWSCL